MGNSPVTLDFSKAQPVTTLDFSKAKPLDGNVPPERSPVYKGFERGFSHSFGLQIPDENNPHSLTLGDMAKQFVNNLAGSAKASWNRVNNFTGEQNNVPGAGTPFSDVLVVPDMIASGIEGMASTLESGGRDLLAALKGGDKELAAQGMGKIVGSASQIFAGMEKNPAGYVSTANKLGEFSPREVKGTDVTGAARPGNLLQGAINKSLGASIRDVRFGDPAKAMIEEGITNLSNNGRLAEVNLKLSQIAPQLNQALSSTKAAINLDDIVDSVVSKAKDKIRLSNENQTTKQTAYDDLATLRDTAHTHAPSGIATAAESNGFKQAVGDSINFEKRPSPLIDQVVNAYKEVYAQVRDRVNQSIGPEAADLNRRMANLKAAQGALREQVLKEKAGTIPGVEGVEASRPLSALKSLAGHVAPGAINATQAIAEPAARAIAGGATIGEQLKSKGVPAPQQNVPELPFHPGTGLARP